MGPSNAAVLSRDNAAWAAKKRQKQNQVREVVFDEEARREFLTGFRKRKLEKMDAAKKRAQQRDKDERLEERRRRRRELAERARLNHEEVEKAYGGDILNSASADIEPDQTAKGKAREDLEMEYENEDQVAIVTVVEDINLDELNDLGVQEQRNLVKNVRPREVVNGETRKVLKTSSTKQKPKKIKYETKAARQVTKRKERGRKLEKAAEARTRKGKAGARKR